MKKKIKLDFLTSTEKKYFKSLTLIQKKELIKQHYKFCNNTI